MLNKILMPKSYFSNFFKLYLIVWIFILFYLCQNMHSTKNSHLSTSNLKYLRETLGKNDILNLIRYLINMNEVTKKNQTIFCIILTKKQSLNTKAKLMYETWVKYCDKYKFISLIPDKILHENKSLSHELNVINGIETSYLNLDILQPPNFTIESYHKLTEKVFPSFKYIYQNYEPHDWYLKCDDDTFVFMDNLRKFVSNKNSSHPVTFGYDFKTKVERGYHSGGAGYLLSKSAFMLLGSTLTYNSSFCPFKGAEDISVARCLRKLKVYPEKSIDEKGRERFHPLNVKRHYKGDWSKPFEWIILWAANKLKSGLECCSDESISFHYMYENETRVLHNFLEKKKQEGKNYLFADLIKELNY